jgi:hypothetical protein
VASGTTQAPGSINDTLDFDGTLTGLLIVTEVASSNSATDNLRPSNSLTEGFLLSVGSTGRLIPIENNQQHSKGTEFLGVSPSPAALSVVGLIDRAFGSSASTSDPSQVIISNTA